MTWDELNNWMLTATAIVSAITFLVGISTIYVGYRAGLEKDEKIRAQVERTGKLELELEKERNAGKELEKSLARRQIPFISGVGGKTNFDSIKVFADFNAIVEYLPEIEARRATIELTEALKIAGWNIVSITPNPELEASFWDGVKIEPYNFSGRVADSGGEMQESRSKSRAATEALVAFLKSNNWEATAMAGKPGDLPLNTIRIKIGFKSFPHIKTPEEEEFFKNFPKFDSNLPTK